MKTADDLTVGGEPRVNLLPQEVLHARRSKVLHRALGITLIAVVVVVAGTVAVATGHAMRGQSNLLAAQTRTTELLDEQVTYIEVRQVQERVDATIAARWLASSTEIDWRDYLGQVRALLPEDVSISTVDIDVASPLEPYGQAVVPLQGVRVATLTLLMTSPTLPAVPGWLTQLEQLPGFVDATPGQITLTDTGVYEVGVVVHIDDQAFRNRFDDPAANNDPSADDDGSK